MPPKHGIQAGSWVRITNSHTVGIFKQMFAMGSTPFPEYGPKFKVHEVEGYRVLLEWGGRPLHWVDETEVIRCLAPEGCNEAGRISIHLRDTQKRIWRQKQEETDDYDN